MKRCRFCQVQMTSRAYWHACDGMHKPTFDCDGYQHLVPVCDECAQKMSPGVPVSAEEVITP